MRPAAGHAGGGGRRRRPARLALLLAVTVLTSLDDGGSRRDRRAGAPGAQALRLGRLALAAGLDGPRLLADGDRRRCARALGAEPSWWCRASGPAAAGDDQKRTMGPAEALALGADVLVIGRPITRAADPAPRRRRPSPRELREAA